MNRKAKNMLVIDEEVEEKIPWRRDCRGRPIIKKVTGTCALCNKILYDNIDPKKIVFCGMCTQAFLAMDPEKRDLIKDKIVEKIKRMSQ